MATVNGLLGRKVGMTQIFGEDGVAVPVTVIECGPCVVVQRKTTEKDGYEAVQLGYLERKTPRKRRKVKRGDSGHRGRGEANKADAGHFAKNGGAAATRHLAEFRLDAEGDEPAAGSSVGVDTVFQNWRRDQDSRQKQRSWFCGRYEASRVRWPKSQSRIKKFTASQRRTARPIQRARFRVRVVRAVLVTKT